MMTSGWARRRVSAVVAVRNDNYGGNLKQRAELTLRAQAYVFDEVVMVDFNSAALTNRSTTVVKSPLIDTLELEVATRANIVSVIINASACAVLMGRPCGQNFYETAARNVGVRAATGDFVVSTNIDDLPPHRELLQGLMARMGPNDALLLPRLEISLQHGAALFRREGGGGVDEALRMLQVRPADYHAAARSGCGSGGTSAWGFERPGWRTCMSLTHLRGLFTERTNRSRAFQAVLLRKKSPAHFLGSQMVLVGCPGDFQMASRLLWSRTSFDARLVHRGYADHTLIAHWLNANATICAPSGAHVLHLVHSYNHGVRTNAPPQWQLDSQQQFLVPGRGAQASPRSTPVLAYTPAIQSRSTQQTISPARLQMF